MIRVNLIPPECLERQRLRTRNVRLAGGAVIVAALAAGITLMHIEAASSMQKRLAAKQKLLQGLGSKVTRVTELETSRDSIKSHLDAINGLLSERYYYPRFMNDISAKLPAGMWLSSIQTKFKDGGAIEFTCSVTSLSGDEIAVWLDRLASMHSFSEVTLGPVNVSGDQTGGQNFSFTVKGVYKAGAN
jgi:Tfp pilus assembly protein PilN